MQPKLRIGGVNDPLEHEADLIADRVLRMPEAAARPATSPAAGLVVRRKCSCGGTCDSCSSEITDDEHGTVRMKPAAAAGSGVRDVAPPIVQEVLHAPGLPLDAVTRGFFEPRLGRDLGRVRVHAGARAGQSAEEIRADAYTVGANMVFAPGQYAPQTPAGKRLLAHELSHVLQQTQAAEAPPVVQRCSCGSGASSGECSACAGTDTVQKKARAGATSDPLEHDAGRADTPEAMLQNDETLAHGGLTLDPQLQRFFESRYGRDLSEVRLHTGTASEARNDQINAHAFTYGNHIWLGRGHQPRADFLLAHELAHVIQQRQPRPLKAHDAETQAESATFDSGRVVRRFGLSDAFWVPLGPKGIRTGTDLHADMLATALASNTALDIEAPAPNGSSNGVGLALQGGIDLYHATNTNGAHAQVGLFFDGPVGAEHATAPPAKPAKHSRASAGGKYNPFVTPTGRIAGIKEAPTTIEIGELKPAAMPAIEKGKQQIKNYQGGMAMAADLTNDWAKWVGGSTDRWTIQTNTTLPDAAVKFVQGTVDMRYNPSSPRDDESLVLAQIVEKKGGVGYKFKVTFNPDKEGIGPIQGGLYAQSAGVPGLWTYFARPKDLKSILNKVKAEVGGHLTSANQVQDQIIDRLFKPVTKAVTATPAPTKSKPLLKDRSSTEWDEREAPDVGRDTNPAIRRAPATPELKDDFDFGTWKQNQVALREQLFGTAAKEDTKKKFKSLDFLERAYQAEETLDKSSVAGKSLLPAKNSVTLDIVTGVGADQKKRSRNLADIASWLKGWTGIPAEILGFFREKFGGAFVWVANKFVAIRDRIREKWKEALEAQTPKSGDSKAKIVAKALLKALVQVGKIILPRTLHLFMDAIVAGVERKLKKLFDIDPRELAEDTFGVPFKKWSDQLTQFQNDAETYVGKLIGLHERDLAWIKDVISAGQQIGALLEIASSVIQCGKKPGWNCVLQLSKEFRACGMEAALNICAVQKVIASILAKLGPLANLPADLAKKALVVVHDVAPKGLEDVFTGEVPGAGGFNKDDVECEDTPPELKCPGIIPMPGESGPKLPITGNKRDEEGDTKEGGKKKEGEGGKPLDEEGGNAPPPPKPPTYGKGPGSDKGPQGPDEQPGVEGQKGGKGEAHGDPNDASGGAGNPQGAVGPAGGIVGLPAPGEVHKALNDLLNEQGPKGMEALAKLIEDAGLPGDAPISAEQVKKLQELLKKGGLTPDQLKKLAEGQTKGGLQGKGKPLQKFLEGEAHKAVLEQTLEKLRQKQYDFKFQEMARLKVHWKILHTHKPGTFKNAPALMWTDTIRAAGVVDGEFGKCYDGGKVSLTITKADMREEGTEHPVNVNPPFVDKAAQIDSGVCPSPPPPPKGGSGGKGEHDKEQGGQGEGSGQGEGTGQGQGAGKGQGAGHGQGAGKGRGASQGHAAGHGPGARDDGKAQATGKLQTGSGESDKKAPQPSEGAGAGQEKDETPEKPGGESGADNEINSGADPGASSGEGKGKNKPGKSDGPEQEKSQEPEGPKFEIDLGALAGSCGLPAKCTDNWQVAFEEMTEAGDGWEVTPDKDPDSTNSILNPRNKISPFSLRPASGQSQGQEIVLTCEGKTCVVGKVEPSPARAGLLELVSGSLLDSLRGQMRKFVDAQRQGVTRHVGRMHFK